MFACSKSQFASENLRFARILFSIESPAFILPNGNEYWRGESAPNDVNTGSAGGTARIPGASDVTGRKAQTIGKDFPPHNSLTDF
jgi:hypothetical protein